MDCFFLSLSLSLSSSVPSLSLCLLPFTDYYKIISSDSSSTTTLDHRDTQSSSSAIILHVVSASLRSAAVAAVGRGGGRMPSNHQVLIPLSLPPLVHLFNVSSICVLVSFVCSLSVCLSVFFSCTHCSRSFVPAPTPYTICSMSYFYHSPPPYHLSFCPYLQRSKLFFLVRIHTPTHACVPTPTHTHTYAHIRPQTCNRNRNEK